MARQIIRIKERFGKRLLVAATWLVAWHVVGLLTGLNIAAFTLIAAIGAVGIFAGRGSLKDYRQAVLVLKVILVALALIPADLMPT